MSDEEEQYEVNFFHKKYMQTDDSNMPNSSTAVDPEESSLLARDDKQEELDRQQRKEVRITRRFFLYGQLFA